MGPGAAVHSHDDRGASRGGAAMAAGAGSSERHRRRGMHQQLCCPGPLSCHSYNREESLRLFHKCNLLFLLMWLGFLFNISFSIPQFNFTAVLLKLRCSSDMLEQVVQVCAEHKKPKKLLKHLQQIKASTGTACCLSSLVTSEVSQ